MMVIGASIKFTQEQYDGFIKAYYSGSYPYLRFGQAFFAHFNSLGMGKMSDPELFYCEDMKEATRLIFQKYIQ